MNTMCQVVWQGVRVLLRVARAGAGHAAECESVAAQVCRVLDMFWSD